MDFIIKGGTIVTSSEMYQADVEVEDGIIKSIGCDLDTAGKEVVDASGMYVLPGAIDLHTHMSDPFGGTVSSDSELTGSRAAACGGVTTMFDFAKQKHGEHLQSAIDRKIGQYEGNACIDYTLHVIVTDLLDKDSALSEFSDVVKNGVNTFKCYSVYRKEGIMMEDFQLPKIMTAAHAAGGMMTLHAENSGLVDFLTEKFVREGKTSSWYHYLSRPEYVSAEADKRAILMAKNLHTPLYIVHMSDREGLEEASKARHEGYPIYIETCPQYLEYNCEVYKRPDAVDFVCSPPMKGEESRQALWRGLRAGDIDTVATDHCPFTKAEKNWGKDDFTKTPNGCGGIENRYPYMLSAANNGKITFEKAVQVCAENPARIFGLKEKGSITVGKDADIVIYDPEKEVTADRTTQHTACDHTIWDGYHYKGYPVQTYLRGTLIYDNGNFIGKPGEGRYIRRSPLS